MKVPQFPSTQGNIGSGGSLNPPGQITPPATTLKDSQKG